MAFQLGMTVDFCMADTLTLVSVTLTLIQGHSGSIEKDEINVPIALSAFRDGDQGPSKVTKTHSGSAEENTI